jgi:tetratricopeptide (TPR) repeat protein
MPADRYKQGTNDYLPYAENPAVQEVNLKQFVDLVKQNSDLLKVSYGEGAPSMMSFPTRKFYLDVDTAAVEKLGLVPADRRKQLVSRMEWDMGKGAIEKKNLVILDMLATNNWKRPIYFSSTVAGSDFMNLQPYFQLEGMAYRVLPLKDPNYQPRSSDEGYVQKELMFENMMKKFAFRNLNKPGIFYDENHLRFPANYRDKFARLANAYLAAGDKTKAKQVLDKAFEAMPDATIPYDYYSPQFVPALVTVGEQARAQDIMDKMTSRAQVALAYYQTHNPALFDIESQTYLLGLQSVYRAAEQVGDQARATKALELLQQYYPRQ